MKHVYFQAAGRSLEAVKQFAADRRHGEKHRREFIARYQSHEVYTEGSRFVGFRVEGAPPDGFKTKVVRFDNGNVTVCVPDKRTRRGRELAKEMDSKPLVIPGWPELCGYLGGGMVMQECRILWPTFCRLGSLVILRIGKVQDAGTAKSFVPPDSTPFKASEYWQLVETLHGGTEPTTVAIDDL